MKALIVIDMQNDFMPWGALAVPQGETIIPIINKLMERFEHVFATLDDHPVDHISFALNHGKKPGDTFIFEGKEEKLWPIHCVQNTLGAELAASLHLNKIEKKFYKGRDPLVDSYSVFLDQMGRQASGLHAYLEQKKITDLYFVGVATDFCVQYSVIDALSLGYNVFVIKDACKGIGSEEKACRLMQKGGAHLIFSKDLLG